MKRLQLPIFVTRENKLAVGAGMFFLAAVLYLTSNHFHFFEPQLLPMYWIDRIVPFMPNTLWIYVSEYLYFLTLYLVCKDMKNVSRFIYSFLGLQVVSVLIFWVWPTTFPRELFPLPEDLNPLTKLVFTTLRQTDTPANCCPSLHVSSVFLCSFIYLKEQREKFPLFFTWATAIALSTLTTKQHYVIDVVAGLGMALTAWWVFHHLVDYVELRKKALLIPARTVPGTGTPAEGFETSTQR